MAGAVRGMVDSLNDPYSVYMDQEEFQEFRQHIEGSIEGSVYLLVFRRINLSVLGNRYSSQ